MSLLSQFFGGGGGSSSTSIESRVLIVDGGKGASCRTQPAPSYKIAGEGGRVYELNVYLSPGSVCPVTVGYGGTSQNRSACIPGASLSPPYTSVPATIFCLGSYGTLSAFSDLVASCTAPVTSDPCGFCYRPESNASNFCSALIITSEKQSVPFDTYDNDPTSKGTTLEETSTIFSPSIPGIPFGCGCYACSGFYTICSTCCATTSSLSNYRVYNAAINNSKHCFSLNPNVPSLLQCCQLLTCFGNPICYTTEKTTITNQFGRGSGYISDITGCVCTYGAGGLISPVTILLCRCDVTYIGSGAGAPGISTATISGGCPGIVVIQYPTDYGAAITSSPNVCDCSPLTTGYRTYKFYCPGSITLP